MFDKKILPSVGITLLLTACGGKDNSQPDVFAGLTGDVENGGFLFNFNCSGCHGLKAQGSYGPNIQGRSARDIQWALNNVEPMNFLPDLSLQEMSDISTHLAKLKQQTDAEN